MFIRIIKAAASHKACCCLSQTACGFHPSDRLLRTAETFFNKTSEAERFGNTTF